MRGKKKKIVLPPEDEVTEYASDSPRGDEATSRPASANGEARSEQPEEEAARRPEADDFKEKFLRAKADLVNYQRRAEKHRADSLRYANARLVQALLPILDDLERVVGSGSESAGSVETVVDGVKLTLDNFLKVLRDFSVSRIEAQGQVFDPAVHEAMMQQDSTEHAEPTVLQEVVKGYQLYDRVLRPARVIVSKPPEASPGQAVGDEGQADT